MIKIDENDLLWKYYKRDFRGYAVPPHPRNLCNYFWTAVRGFFKSFMTDWSVFLTVPILAGLAAASCLARCRVGSHPSGALLEVMTALFGFLAVFETAYRFCCYWQNRDERVLFLGGSFGLFVVAGGVVSLAFTGGSFWQAVLWGYGVVAVLMTVFAFTLASMFLLTHVSNPEGAEAVFGSKYGGLVRDVGRVLRATKDRVCPLVEPPQSWKEAEREKELNCGDG